jgi:hypothetical protein
MPRRCPSYGTTMGRLVTNRSKLDGVAWYRFAPSRFHCPHCHVGDLPVIVCPLYGGLTGIPWVGFGVE